MEETDPLEDKILNTIGEQPLHLRMIHRIVNDRTEEPVTVNQIQQKLDRLAEAGFVEKQGQNFEIADTEQ